MAYNKNELVRKIQSLQELSNEEKSALLELLRTHKKYGLVWEDKPEEVEERLRSDLPVLKEVKERAIISDDPDAPNHILIEGDNLEALVALTYTHAGKIDVIYIDPPYNTGNQDFVYNDNYVEAEDSFRHSKWLSFMSKRLIITKTLLSDEGIIFISIDEHEQAALKLLCDEIFGEDNFVSSFFWKRTETPPALSYKVRKKFEFVLCYQKTNIVGRKFAQGYTDGGDAPLLNAGNPLGTLCFPSGSVHFNIPDGVYKASPSLSIQLLEDVIVKDGINLNSFRAQAHFKWQQSNLEREISEGTYFLIKGRTFSIRYQKSSKAIKAPSNIIDSDVNVGTNEEANKTLRDVGLHGDFDYAKPVSLVKFLIRMPFWENKHTTVLDFFAGSGTTLQATMELNAEDSGNRKCIIVTNNENGICENVTYQRNLNVIQGFTTPRGEEVTGLSNNSLRYYKTAFVGREHTSKGMRELMYASTELLCIKNDLYTEVQVLSGKKLNAKIARYFDDGKRRMLVVYQEESIPAIAELIASMDYPGKMMVYVFSPGNYPYEDEFVEVLDKVELCALPAAIYNAYRKVLPRKKVVKLPEAEEDDTSVADTATESDNIPSPEGQLNLNFGE